MGHTIRILATTDLHGYIFPYSYADGSPQNSGMAKLSTKIKHMKDENTIVINNGDDLQGSPLAYYHFTHFPNEVSPMSKALNCIPFDFHNIGNHDFNYGEEALLKHIDSLHAQNLTGNVLYKGERLGLRYAIKEICGKKIALFGMCTQYIPHWEEPKHIINFSFIDAYEYAKETVRYIQVHESVDYIVGVYHGGFERDLNTGEPAEELTGENLGYQMMQDIDGLDILITGHQHRQECGEVNGTVYTQTPANGLNLACVEIDIDTDTITSHIIELDENQEVDKEMLAIVQKEEDDCQKWLDIPLGTSRVNLEIHDEFDARLHKSQVVTFLNALSIEVGDSDIAANAIFKGARGFQKEITMRDLVGTYPFPNTLVVKEVTGKILKEYLEFDAQYWALNDEGEIIVNPSYKIPKEMDYNYDMLDGISYTIKVSNPIGSKITALMYKGKPVKGDDTFRLCINNYRAAGGGDFHMLKDAKTVKVIEKSVVELIADWLNKNHVIDFIPNENITIEK